MVYSRQSAKLLTGVGCFVGGAHMVVALISDRGSTAEVSVAT